MKCVRCGIRLNKKNISDYDDMCKPCYKVKCDGCFYNQSGCRCEEMMAAGCIPSYTFTPLENTLGENI